MNSFIDVNVWNGQFPFRRIAGTNVEEIEERFPALGFGGVVVSPLEAIFQEDSYGAEEVLFCELQTRPGTLGSVWHFKVVNPACNWWQRDLQRAVQDLGVSGIRLCPTFHGYRLDDLSVADVMAAASTLNLPVQVMCKMQDWRMEWLMHTADVEIDQVHPFLERFGAQPTVLSGLHFSDMIRLADAVRACPGLLLDSSRLKGPWQTFEKLVSVVDVSHLCFGSLWPINLPECPLKQVEHASLAADAKEAILAGNATGILKR